MMDIAAPRFDRGHTYGDTYMDKELSLISLQERLSCPVAFFDGIFAGTIFDGYGGRGRDGAWGRKPLGRYNRESVCRKVFHIAGSRGRPRLAGRGELSIVEGKREADASVNRQAASSTI